VTSLPAEVCVIGGGPAGSTTARRLAEWGHRVVLVDRTAHGPERIESLPPSIRNVLDILGLSGRIAAAGFATCPHTRLRWSDDGETVRPHPGTLIVERSRFDTILREAAGDAGVAASVMPLKVPVLCQIVPVVLVPKNRVPVDVETGFAQA